MPFELKELMTLIMSTQEKPISPSQRMAQKLLSIPLA